MTSLVSAQPGFNNYVNDYSNANQGRECKYYSSLNCQVSFGRKGLISNQEKYRPSLEMQMFHAEYPDLKQHEF
jgi:hypothetical protein